MPSAIPEVTLSPFLTPASIPRFAVAVHRSFCKLSCLSSVSFVSSPHHLHVLSLYALLSFQRVHEFPRSRESTLSCQQRVRHSQCLRAALARAPVRTNSHVSWSSYELCALQPTLTCPRRLRRSWHMRRKPRLQKSRSFLRSSRPLASGRYTFVFRFFFVWKRLTWAFFLTSSRTSLVMTKSPSTASLAMSSMYIVRTRCGIVVN
jgi:hypothetical protein